MHAEEALGSGGQCPDRSAVGDAQVMCLIVNAGGTYHAHLVRRGARVVLGRSELCDVRIHHESISDEHAVMELRDGLRVTDLGSRCGTYVARRRLRGDETVEVDLQTVLALGSADVAVLLVDAAALTAPSVRQRVARECARSARSGAPLAYVRLRIDGGTGTARAAVDALIWGALRESDLSGTDETGEHELLLVDTDLDGARRAMERLAVALGEVGATCRYGVACYPVDGATDAQLIERATEQLQRSCAASPAGPSWTLLVEQVAPTSVGVLLLGETGVGKEVCATRIHQLSPRRDRPFIKLNCAAFSEHLLESELFGHERGAFTGAERAKPGLLEAADGGTLLLDEIGDLPLSLQAKLLRVVEDREVLRIGALTTRRVDVRFIAATNRPLEDDIEQGRFRADLFYRVSGLVIAIPPLRERLGEIERLAVEFVRETRGLAEAPAFSPAAMSALLSYAWPGNIRELRNVLERAVLLCGAGPIRPDHLLFASNGGASSGPAPRSGRRGRLRRASLNEELAELEKRQILDALERCGANQTRAARLLGIARNTLQRRMDDYQIPRPRK